MNDPEKELNDIQQLLTLCPAAALLRMVAAHGARC
jgi:hypothetical protein